MSKLIPVAILSPPWSSLLSTPQNPWPTSRIQPVNWVYNILYQWQYLLSQWFLIQAVDTSSMRKGFYLCCEGKKKKKLCFCKTFFIWLTCDVCSPEEHIHVHTYQLFAVVNGAKCVFSLSLDGYSGVSQQWC